jgi:hypothetical protein
MKFGQQPFMPARALLRYRATVGRHLLKSRVAHRGRVLYLDDPEAAQAFTSRGTSTTAAARKAAKACRPPTGPRARCPTTPGWLLIRRGSVLEFLNFIERQAAGLYSSLDRWPTAPPKRRADVGPHPYGSNLVAAIDLEMSARCSVRIQQTASRARLGPIAQRHIHWGTPQVGKGSVTLGAPRQSGRNESPAQGLNSADLFRRCNAGRKRNDNEVRGGTRMARLPFIFLFLSVSLGSASAQGGHLGTPQEQQACSRDASRFCRKQLGDDTSVQQCLQRNRAKLSAACKKVFESHGM